VALLSGLEASAEDKARIGGGNAATLFGLA
jgi:hypothetical protein